MIYIQISQKNTQFFNTRQLLYYARSTTGLSQWKEQIVVNKFRIAAENHKELMGLIFWEIALGNFMALRITIVSVHILSLMTPFGRCGWVHLFQLF